MVGLRRALTVVVEPVTLSPVSARQVASPDTWKVSRMTTEMQEFSIADALATLADQFGQLVDSW